MLLLHYFTEKILDCFRTRTVPIYWGCTNIREHFEADGIIVLDCDFTVLLTNTRVEHCYASRVPLVGEKCFAVLHDRIRPCPECPYVRSLATGQPQAQVMRSCGSPSIIA